MSATRNFLFVCSQNKLRSPTAEHIFADRPGIATMSAGTNRHADTGLSDDLVEWADVIFVMERTHRAKLRNQFRSALKDKRIVVLNIPDDYAFMDQALIDLLEDRMRPWLRSG